MKEQLEESLRQAIDEWLTKPEVVKMMAEENLENYPDLPHEMTEWSIKALFIQQ